MWLNKSEYCCLARSSTYIHPRNSNYVRGAVENPSDLYLYKQSLATVHALSHHKLEKSPCNYQQTVSILPSINSEPWLDSLKWPTGSWKGHCAAASRWRGGGQRQRHTETHTHMHAQVKHKQAHTHTPSYNDPSEPRPQHQTPRFIHRLKIYWISWSTWGHTHAVRRPQEALTASAKGSPSDGQCELAWLPVDACGKTFRGSMRAPLHSLHTQDLQPEHVVLIQHHDTQFPFRYPWK